MGGEGAGADLGKLFRPALAVVWLGEAEPTRLHD